MVTNYKWELRKGSAKMICPNCGQKRFVPYVSAADHTTLAGPEFGRCDREQSCGYQRYPNGKEAPNVQSKVIEPQPMMIFYPAAVRTDVNTNLFQYAASLFGVSRAMIAWQRYFVGKDGERTVFWQIAKDGTIRAGKSIPYGTDGHRIKTDPYPANWLHKQRHWDGYHTQGELRQCFFGEHLLAREAHKDKPVAIVESEKTAILMSEISPEWVWLASGGSQGLKNDEKNRALEGRNVMLLPDNGQYWNWKAAADRNGWECANQIELYPCFSGCDILDMVEAGAFGQDLLKRMRK